MAPLDLVPVILSGGIGSRLWPLSRADRPKQLLRLRGDRTLLQESVARLDGLASGPDGDGPDGGPGVAVTDPLLVCNEAHRFLIAEQLRAMGREAAAIVLEPAGRNTAPALTLAALAAVGGRPGDGDPLLLAMPSDHAIGRIGAFHAAIRAGLPAASAGAVVTFGIVPTRAETGYGYIRVEGALDPGAPGAARAGPIEAFVEKPDAATAETYVASGRYLWNSGLFLVRASVWLDAIERYAPAIARACRAANHGGRHDEVFFRPDPDCFRACPSNSIDYAVMERLVADAAAGPDAASVVPMDAGWSDIGGWKALWDLSDKDASGNVLGGDVHPIDLRDSLVLAESRFVAAVGLRNAVVVETGDALLVTDLDHAQAVREVVPWLDAAGREEGRLHHRERAAWGSRERLGSAGRIPITCLRIDPGSAMARPPGGPAGRWFVVRGTARVTRGAEETVLTEGESVEISGEVATRLENRGPDPLTVLEAAAERPGDGGGSAAGPA